MQPCVNQIAKKNNLTLYIYFKMTHKEKVALKNFRLWYQALRTKAPFLQRDILISFYFKLNAICTFFLFLSLPFPHYIYLPFLDYTIMLNCPHIKYSSALNMSFKNINLKNFCLHTKHTAQFLCQLFIWFQITAGDYCFKCIQLHQ